MNMRVAAAVAPRLRATQEDRRVGEAGAGAPPKRPEPLARPTLAAVVEVAGLLTPLAARVDLAL